MKVKNKNVDVPTSAYARFGNSYEAQIGYNGSNLLVTGKAIVNEPATTASGDHVMATHKWVNDQLVGAGAGTSGTSGTSGSSGNSGTSGTSGVSGTSGSSGTSGVDGSSGTSGSSGSSGTSASDQIPLSDHGGDYTITSTDSASLVRIDSTAVSTVYVPSNSVEALPVGFNCIVTQFSSGQVTIASDGNGATIVAAGGEQLTRVQYSTASLIKVETDVWLLSGDLTS